MVGGVGRGVQKIGMGSKTLRNTAYVVLEVATCSNLIYIILGFFNSNEDAFFI
jgi:hypothetical protein